MVVWRVRCIQRLFSERFRQLSLCIQSTGRNLFRPSRVTRDPKTPHLIAFERVPDSFFAKKKSSQVNVVRMCCMVLCEREQ